MAIDRTELMMRLYEERTQAALRATGGTPEVRDVLSSDNPHHRLNYGAGDPFYSGPPLRSVQETGGTALHFAQIERPDLEGWLPA